MLTQLPLNSTTVTLDRNSHNGEFNVYLAGNQIGSFEMVPVWGLNGDEYQSAIGQGLDIADECYVCDGRVFITQHQSAAYLVAAKLTSTAAWKIPDYV